MATIKQFGNTWWGKAWLSALEERALEDPNRLPRGRTYARQDRVRDLELSPGELRASVWGNSHDPYTTTLSIRVLPNVQWEHLLDEMMNRASNVATLLAGEVPREIGDRVLPDRGELSHECSCPDAAEPCKHVAALCYVAADLFDADPFALLTLRGRGRDAVLNEVRARRSTALGVELAPSSGEPRGADPGVSAMQAWRREPDALQRSAPLRAHPAEVARLAVAPGIDSGVDLDELADLINDAAARAWAMLAADEPSGLHLSVGADVVRRAASGDLDAIARATGVDPVELAAAVVAWQRAGHNGFKVHSSKPDLDATQMAPGAYALGDAARVRGNTVNQGKLQLRLDEDRRWWRFRADDELGWVLADGPADHPGDLL